jgi:hypothetical protein
MAPRPDSIVKAGLNAELVDPSGSSWSTNTDPSAEVSASRKCKDMLTRVLGFFDLVTLDLFRR